MQRGTKIAIGGGLVVTVAAGLVTGNPFTQAGVGLVSMFPIAAAVARKERRAR